MAEITLELSEHVIDAIADAVVKKMQETKPEANDKIKALSEDLKICQKSIKDKKALVGFNMAIALINKHLAENKEE